MDWWNKKGLKNIGGFFGPRLPLIFWGLRKINREMVLIQSPPPLRFFKNI